MSYNPEQVLQKIRLQKGNDINQQQRQQQPFLQQQQQKQVVLDQQTVEQLFNKINSLENHVRGLENNLQQAHEEIGTLKSQKPRLDDNFIEYDDQNLDQYNKIDTTNFDILDVMSKEPIEKILHRKEKNFNRFANSNSSHNKSKPAGHLKLEQLNQILQEYPHLTRPIIHIKLTDADFE